MSKSGNYNLSEIYKRDALIHDLAAELRFWMDEKEPYPFATAPKLAEYRDRWRRGKNILAQLTE